MDPSPNLQINIGDYKNVVGGDLFSQNPCAKGLISVFVIGFKRSHSTL